MIKLDIDAKQTEKVKKPGGLLLPDGKTWVIPDERDCHKCGKETAVVQLGVRTGSRLFLKMVIR